jgi:hypothetical protein
MENVPVPSAFACVSAFIAATPANTALTPTNKAANCNFLIFFILILPYFVNQDSSKSTMPSGIELSSLSSEDCSLEEETSPLPEHAAINPLIANVPQSSQLNSQNFLFPLISFLLKPKSVRLIPKCSL